MSPKKVRKCRKHRGKIGLVGAFNVVYLGHNLLSTEVLGRAALPVWKAMINWEVLVFLFAVTAPAARRAKQSASAGLRRVRAPARWRSAWLRLKNPQISEGFSPQAGCSWPVRMSWVWRGGAAAMPLLLLLLFPAPALANTPPSMYILAPAPNNEFCNQTAGYVEMDKYTCQNIAFDLPGIRKPFKTAGGPWRGWPKGCSVHSSGRSFYCEADHPANIPIRSDVSRLCVKGCSSQADCDVGYSCEDGF